MKRRRRVVKYFNVFEIERCEICGGTGQQTNHHQFRSAVWRGHLKNQEFMIKRICRKCHNLVENEITKQENIILRQHPEIYTSSYEKVKRSIQNGKLNRNDNRPNEANDYRNADQYRQTENEACYS